MQLPEDEEEAAKDSCKTPQEITEARPVNHSEELAEVVVVDEEEP